MEQTTRIGLPTQMAIGLACGILAGLAAPALGLDTATWFRPLGQLFISLIRMVVVPLVLATIIAGAAGIHDVNKLGRVAFKTLVYYFLTTAVAIVIALIIGNLTDPGAGAQLTLETAKAKDITAPNLIATLLAIVPVNPIDGLAKGNMLQVIFFAILFGFALSGLGEAGSSVQRFFEQLGDVMIRMTNMVMRFAPIGVFGLMADTVSRHGLSVLLPLGKLIVVMYVVCIVHVVLVYLPLIRLTTGLSFKTFLRGVSAPVLVAFTTCSSAAALPLNLLAARRLGASRSVSSFTIPLGNTINMDGTAMYMALTAVFAATVYGIDLTLEKQLLILLMGVMASIGTAGVPGAGLIMSTMVFAQVGIPLEAITLIAGIDRVMDMARTSINVFGDATGALVVSKLEGEFDTDPLDESETAATV